MTAMEKDKYLEEYLDRENIQLDREFIKRNPGWREVAKFMLTSLWGKFGQCTNLLQVKICTTMRDV